MRTVALKRGRRRECNLLRFGVAAPLAQQRLHPAPDEAVRLVDRPAVACDPSQQPAGGERLQLRCRFLTRQFDRQRRRDVGREGRPLEQIAPGRRCGVEHPIEQVEVDLVDDRNGRSTGDAAVPRSSSQASTSAAAWPPVNAESAWPSGWASLKPCRQCNAFAGFEFEPQVVAQREAARGDRVEEGRRRRFRADEHELQPRVGNRDESRERVVPCRVANLVRIVEHENQRFAARRMDCRGKALRELALAFAVLRRETRKPVATFGWPRRAQTRAGR